MIPIHTQLEKARILLNQDRPSEAEKMLSEVLRNEPENHEALSLLTRCKYDQRQYSQGMDIIRTAISFDPQEDYYYYLLAFGHYQLSQNLPAENFLNKAIAINPVSSDYYGLLALVLIEERRFKEALAKADEGLALDASNIVCLNARSTALNKLRQTEEAIVTMKDALQQDPENDFTHTNVGWNLLEKGRHREATVHFSEALRINPNLDNARTGLKESLKSRIAPYRWLLQYSFWINNRGKKARWIVPIALYLLVRTISNVSQDEKGPWGTVGLVVGAAYLLFVATSWFMNPLANFFLFFHPKGRFALTHNEKWNSVLLVSSLCLSVLLFMMVLFGQDENSRFLIGAVIALTLGVPLGHMDWPIRWRSRYWHDWFAALVVIAGIIALIIALSLPAMVAAPLAIYGLGFIAYTWMAVFRNG